MGTADIVTKEYMRENTVFADAFNYLIYNGKKVIDPEKLCEMDTTEMIIPTVLEENTGLEKEAVQRYRDVLKSAVIKQDEDMSYVLLGIENQTDVHYAMPVRNAIYDMLQYGKQITDIASEHRRNKKDFEGKSKGEFLSGFLKEDHIKPVITLVIHFGDEKWDGPLSLHEMMSTRSMDILSFVENYRIHLIDPAKLDIDELGKFSTSLKEVMGYIKYSKNKEKLLAFLKNDSHKTIEANAARVIKMITNSPIRMREDTEKIEMCKAIDDLIIEGEARGIIEICYDLCLSEEDILKKLQSKLNIPLQEASEYLRQYDPKEGRILGKIEWKDNKIPAGPTA